MKALPVGPLLERAACGAGIPVCDVSAKVLARMVGVTPDTSRRWIQKGLVPVSKADRVAVALGWHPDAIWGASWDSEESLV